MASRRRVEMTSLRASERLVQELTGCSLPPQVEEDPLGAVLLSVTHILPSTAVGGEEETTSVGIPHVSLVRVRWWGEDKPDTLFRPVRVGHDDSGRVGGGGDEEEKGEDAEEEEEETRSWIRMRYPVCAPAEQLLEYFHDMRELVLDVIDGTTRRRYGTSTIPLTTRTSHDGESVMEKLEKLRYTNELMEIRALDDPDHVVGYLAVNFEVEWYSATAITPSKWVNVPSTPSISVTTAMIDHPAAHAVPFFDPGSARKRLSFSSISSSSTGGDRYDRGYTPFSSSYAQGRDDIGKVVTNTRLEQLLAKGRALQQSMSQAAEYENVQAPPDPLALIADNLSPSNPVLARARMSTMLAPYEAVTEEQDTDWQRVLNESEQIPRREASTAEVLRDLEVVADVRMPCDANAIEIRFDSLEFEAKTVERLRQLRDTSVSTRFCPIEITVTHDDPASLMGTTDDSLMEENKTDAIKAFTITSSLRKHHLRPNYSHTVPIVSSSRRGTSRMQIHKHSMQFRVRCEAQPTLGARRRRSVLIPRRSIELVGKIPTEEIFSPNQDDWSVSIPLRITQQAPAEPGKQSKTTSRRRPRTPPCDGRLEVTLTLCSIPKEEDSHLDGDSQSEQDSEFSNYATQQVHANQQIRSISPHTQGIVTTLRKQLKQQPSPPITAPVPIFFALMVETVRLSFTVPHENKTGAFALRVEYAAPSFFSESQERPSQPRRAIRSPLHSGIDNHHPSVFTAKFSHLNAFPFDISDQSIISLQGGFLILELWVEEKTLLPSHPIATFLGVAKIPLRSFQFVFRDGKLHGLCRQISPLVGIDEEIPIANPLNGTTTGSIHVKIALGTAEQLFNLRATIKAVTKLQSIVRGYQVRQALGFPIWHLESSAQSSQLLTPSSDYDDVGFSQAIQHDTSPGVPPRMVERSVRFIQLDIRLELRDPSAQQRGFSTVGCEVHGQLRLGNEALVLGADGGLHFVLWWDANDQRLNSQFVHSFHSHNGSAMEIRLHDVSALFQIIPQHVSKGVSTGEDIGQAALDLSSLWHSSTVQSSTEKEECQTIVRDVDLPITWSPGNRSGINALPLRVSIKIYQEDATTDAEPTQQTATIEDELVVTSTTIATMERLLPATLALCFDFQRLSDLKMLVSEVWKGLSTRTDVEEESRVLVRSIFETGHGFLAMEFSICLGIEVHNAEKQSKTVVYDNASRRWFKQFRLEAMPVDIVDGVQLLPSVACVEALVVVHPELIEKLQESNLEVSLWLRGEEAKTATTLSRIDLGVVSVPLAPILFRPNGVQGSFPVQNSKGFAGRLGVHLFIEHDSNDDGDARENPEESCLQNAMDHLSHPSVSERLQNSLAKAHNEDSSEDNVGPGNVSIDSGGEDTAVKTEDAIIVSTNEDTGDHTSEAIKPSSSQTEEVGTLAQTVASINEATQEINLRLQRLLLSSSAPVSEVGESVTSSVGMTEKAEPMPTLVDDRDREDDRCKTLAVEYAGIKDDMEDGGVMEIHEIHSASASEGSPLRTMWHEDHVKSGADEDDNDDEYFQPITLASLGISEMELSPVSDRTSASLYAVPLGEDEAASQPRSSPIPQLADDDSFVDQLAFLSSEEENANDGGVADELELPSVFADSTETVEEECRQVELHETDKSTQLGEVDSVENEAIELSDNQGQCIEMPELQHDCDDNMLDDWNNPSTCFSEQDDSNAEEDSCDVDIGTTDIQDAEAIPQQHLHEIPAGDTEEAASAAVEGYLVEDSSAAGSPINPPHVQERSENSPLTAFVGFKGFDLSVCSSRLSTATTTEDKSTQVEIGDIVDTFNLLEEEKSGETESRRTSHSMDVPSSEVPDDISVHRDHAHERDASTDNYVLDEPAPSRLQMSRQSNDVDAGCQTEAVAVSSHEMPTANSSDQGIRVESVALPIEKFNLAWQLLSEIRSVYVDGVTPAASPLKTTEYQPFASGRSSFLSSSLVYEEKEDLEANSDGHDEEEVLCRHPRQYEMETTRTVGQGFDVDAFQDERYGERHEHRMASGGGYDHHNHRVVREMEDRGPSSWQWLNKEELQKEIIVRIKASGADEDDVKWSEVVSSPKSQWRSNGIGHLSSAVRVTSATSVARPTSAKRSLFKDDTETERIARIMQGSIKYWLQDSSEEEFTSDDEDGGAGAGFF